MTSLTQLFRLNRLLTISCTAGFVVALGCSEPPPPPKEKRVTERVETAPVPTNVPIAELMKEHGIDDRVWFNEQYMPDQDSERAAAMIFFDGFATGRPDRIKPMLDTIEQQELDVLVETGAMSQLASEIDGIEILVGSTPDGITAILGLIEFADRIEGMMWEVVNTTSDGSYVLRAAPTPPGIHSFLGSDPFSDWYARLDLERALLVGMDLGMEQDAGVAAADSPFGPESGGGSSTPSGSGR